MLRRPALIASLSLVLAAGVLAAPRPKIAVVKSSELGPYAQLVAGFAAEVKGQVEEFTLQEGQDGAAATMRAVAKAQPALVLAIGPAAAVNARRQFSDVPVIFVMVPYFQKYELEGPNTTGIALTSDLNLELDAIKEMTRKVKRVGVVEDPRYSQKFVEDAAQLATSKGLSLVPLELDSPARLDAVLSRSKGKIDALVLISDKTVSTAAVVERLIAYSKDEKVPAIGLAPAQVKQGALMALSPSPVAIGQQAGRIANRVLIEKVDIGAMAVAPPEGVELHVNIGTALRLGAEDAQAADVLRFAAKRGLAVKVQE
jgi:putative ABC transport system substrate-binding protein